MFGSSVIEVAIGLVFIFLLLSLICSAANEIIESFLKNRATDLERGLQELFNQKDGGDLTAKFYNHPLISGLFQGPYKRPANQAVKKSDFLLPTNLPSYIPARNFAFAVIDLLLHPPAQTPQGSAAPAVSGAVLPVTLDAVRDSVRRNLGSSQVGRALRTLTEQSGNDVNALRQNVEDWFNGSMDRVSGVYKRRTKWIIFAIGLVLTIFLNVNTITIARRLSTDATLRNLVVAQAEAFSKKPDATTADFEKNRTELESLGLPIGWPNGVQWPQDFKVWDHLLLPLMGWLLTASAISVGAPFWFDLLNKFMVIRATVKPHEKSGEEGSEDRPDRNDILLAAAITGRPGVAPSPPSIPAPSIEMGTVAMSPEPNLNAAPDPEDNASDLEGCEIPVDNPTPDEELPPTKGGVG